MEARELSVTHVCAGEGRSSWLMGELYTTKAAGEETGGAFALVEVSTPPEGGPPPHIHHREDETFYVLEGALEFMSENSVFTAVSGSFVHVPRGSLCTYKNAGTTPARSLAMVAPAGFERFFEEAGEPATDDSSPPPGEPDIEKVLTVASEYGLEVPPPE